MVGLWVVPTLCFSNTWSGFCRKEEFVYRINRTRTVYLGGIWLFRFGEYPGKVNLPFDPTRDSWHQGYVRVPYFS